MAITWRVLLVASSASLLLIIAISLASAIEIRAPLPKLFHFTVAQAAQIKGAGQGTGVKGNVNGTDFNRGDIWHGTSLVPGGEIGTAISSAATGSAEGILGNAPTPRPRKSQLATDEGELGSTPTPNPKPGPDWSKSKSMTATDEGMLGLTPTPQPTKSWDADGVLGPVQTPSPSPLPLAPQPTAPQMPIVALSYAGSGGPKHCRGKMIQKMSFPRPLENWMNGTCIDLPAEARCGIFWSAKGDNCEAKLYNVPKCFHSSRTYVNTVVFMPEERPVGALWQSMWVTCGVDVPESKLIDPAVLGGLLKPKKKPGQG